MRNAELLAQRPDAIILRKNRQSSSPRHNDRYGTLANILRRDGHVRYCPKSDRNSDLLPGRKVPTSDIRCRCEKMPRVELLDYRVGAQQQDGR